MTHDVDDVAVGCSDEEPAHTPWLCGQRMHDLVAELLSFFVGTFDVVRKHGNDRIFRCACVPRYELDIRHAVGRGVAGHPSHVELLGAQPEVVGVEALGRVDVSHSKVCHDALGLHAVLLPRNGTRLSILRMPGEKLHDCPSEEVIAIPGHHMSGAADIDEVNLREACNELVASLLSDEIAHLSTHQKHGHTATENRVDRRVKPIYFCHFDRRKRRGAVDELRIPMPEPAAIALAEVCPEAVEIGRSGAV